MINTNKNENLSDDESFELIKSGRIPDEEITDAELERLLDRLDDEEQGQVQLVPSASVPAPVKKGLSISEQVKQKIEAKWAEDARRAKARARKRSELKTKQSLPTPAPVKEELLLSKVDEAIEAPEAIPEFDSEYYQKRFAEIAEAVTEKRFTGALQQEFERINEMLTLRGGIPPASRNFQKFRNVEYKNEAQKGRYGIAEQKANLHWLWVHHRETLTDLCTDDPDLISDFFCSDEYSDDLAHKIATLQGNVDYSKGCANFLSSAKKCELLGLPDYIQRELSVFHSEGVKKEKQRQAREKQKEVKQIAKQEREKLDKLRKRKIQLAEERRKLEGYQKNNPLRNKQDPDLEEVWNVRLAMIEVEDNSKRRSEAMAIYEDKTGNKLSPSSFSRRIDHLKKVGIL